MTTLDKDVVRFDADSNLTVKLTPQGLMLRQKGRRKWFGPLPYGLLFVQAVRAEVKLPGPSPVRVTHRVSRGLLTTGTR